MRKNVEIIVVHGAGEPRRRDGRIYWEPMLERSLGSGYRVNAPRMPKPDEPHYRTWAQRIAELIEEAERPVLVGHSFGASVLLKYLSEAEPLPSFTGLFLIATPFWGPDFPEFALPVDFAERLRDVRPIYLYHSRDDQEISLDHLKRYQHALPHATVRILDGRGHEFDQPTFPELVDDIRAVVERES